MFQGGLLWLGLIIFFCLFVGNNVLEDFFVHQVVVVVMRLEWLESSDWLSLVGVHLFYDKRKFIGKVLKAWSHLWYYEVWSLTEDNANLENKISNCNNKYFCASLISLFLMGVGTKESCVSSKCCYLRQPICDWNFQDVVCLSDSNELSVYHFMLIIH